MHFLKAILWATVLLSINSLAICSAEERPNIVVIFIDDLGYKDLGCYGSSFYETPRIDAFAKEGVRFTQFYSAHPVCSPTRAALMTGKTPARVGIVDWIPQPSDITLPKSETTIAEALEEGGYETGYIGKWHLGEDDDEQPSSHGFQWQRCVNRAGQPGSYFYPFKRGPRKNRPNAKKPYWNVPDLDDGQKGDYLTDRLTDYAIEFVEKDRQAPFFLCLSHYAVHTPIQSPEALVKKYKSKSQELGDSPESTFEKGGAETRSRQDHPGYAAMVENLDSNVGRLLDAINAKGIKDNTIVVFTSDNGGLSTLRNRPAFTCQLPLRAGKGWCYEGGIRVPMIVRWPEKISPAETDSPSITMDIYPTLLDLAGLSMKPKQHLDGVSLRAHLEKGRQAQESPRLMGWHYPKRHGSGHRPSTAFRYGNKKLIHFIEDDSYELYDISKDISESKNLAPETDTEILNSMKTKLHRWVNSTRMK